MSAELDARLRFQIQVNGVPVTSTRLNFVPDSCVIVATDDEDESTTSISFEDES